MLVEFSVANYRSINEQQTMSLVASAAKELRAKNVVSATAPATPDLLRSAVIYGANAAGKSNLVHALNFMRDLVVNSAQKGQRGDEIRLPPFLMGEPDQEAKPTTLEVIFVEQGVRYQYGFTLTKQRVESEWLTAYPKGSKQTWFFRATEKEEWKFGAHLKGQRSIWKDATRDNALFLSTAVQLNAEQLEPVFSWFKDRLRIIPSHTHFNRRYSAENCDRDTEKKIRIINLLKWADLGVDNLETSRIKFDPATLSEDIPAPLRQSLIENLEGKEHIDVRLVHKTAQGRDVSLDIDDESSGTEALFALAGPWLNVLEKGKVLVFDELDTSLHPLLMRNLVQMFHDPKISTNEAQLLFTTHDTTILDSEVFRRDQIWFVEKDRQLQTKLYPLTDFSPRKSENLERYYLQGRYGALPFIGEWRV